MPRILEVLPNKSTYLSGESAEIAVSVLTDAGDFFGTLVIELNHLDETLATRRIPVSFEGDKTVENPRTSLFRPKRGEAMGLRHLFSIETDRSSTARAARSTFSPVGPTLRDMAFSRRLGRRSIRTASPRQLSRFGDTI